MHNWQRQKRRRLLLMGLVSLGLLLSSALRWVPRGNDFASGAPEPMRRLAAILATSFGKALTDSPVLVMMEPQPECKKPSIAKTFNGDRLYIVLRYRENPPSLCETLYGNATTGSDPQEIISLSETAGRNYGRRIGGPVKVVPVGYSFLRFPDALPSLLDWRTPEDPTYSLSGKGRVLESFPSGVSLSLNTDYGSIVSFRDLIAARHDAANDVLLWCVGIFALGSLATATGLWVLFVKCGRHCHAHGLNLTLPVFLRTDLHTLSRTEAEGVSKEDHTGPIDARAGGWGRKKQVIIVMASVDILLGALCVLVRLTPRLSEEISGPPEYVRIITDKFARLTAQIEDPRSPVIMMQDENGRCEPIPTSNVPPEPAGVYYVLTYSESLHLSCFTVYVRPLGGRASPGAQWVTIRPEEGKNYGQELHAPIRAVAFHRSVKTYTSEYLSLLHWRVRPHSSLPQDLIAARNYPPENQPFDLQEPQFFQTRVALPEVRAGVARKNDRVNSLLLAGVGLAAIFLVALAVSLWLLARRFARQCTEFGLDVDLTAVLAENPDFLLLEAKRSHEARKLEFRERVRREALARRNREEIEQRLHFLLEVIPEGSQRNRIRNYLNNQDRDSEEMQRLWMEFQRKIPERTPEARLELLLDSFKEYCTEEEFSLARAETFTIFTKSGYREARDHAVSLHDRLRRRAKALEQIAAEATLKGTNE